MEKNPDTIGNRTRDLPVCSVVPWTCRYCLFFKTAVTNDIVTPEFLSQYNWRGKFTKASSVCHHFCFIPYNYIPGLRKYKTSKTNHVVNILLPPSTTNPHLSLTANGHKFHLTLTIYTTCHRERGDVN